MSKKNKFALIATIIFSSIIITGGLIFLGIQIGKGGGEVSAADIEKEIENYVLKQQEEANKPKVVEGDFSDDDAFLGDEDAPVTLVEFSDFQCPYCRSFYNDTYSEIKKNFVDTGKVKFVYRDYPLSFHDGAFPAALAAECARDQGGNDTYFSMHDMIFDGQNALGTGTVEIPEEDLVVYAQNLNLDMDEFGECFESEKFKDEIYKDQSVGQSIGINGTPGFVLEGQIISGAQPYSVFEEALNLALSNK
ncbi:MAG: DsbA family protein [Nitrospirota bacterium]